MGGDAAVGAAGARHVPPRLAEFVGTGRESGLDHFFQALDVFIAISVGVLVGNAFVLRFSHRI